MKITKKKFIKAVKAGMIGGVIGGAIGYCIDEFIKIRKESN